MDSLNHRASRFLGKNRNELAVAALERQFGLAPGTWEENRNWRLDKSLQDENYHLSYLAEAIALGDKSLYLDYIGWCKVFFEGIRLPEESVRATFANLADFLPTLAPADCAPTIAEYLNAALDHYLAAPSSISSFIPEGSKLGSLARSYMEALLEGRREDAGALVLGAAESGVDIKDIYLHVFQPSQREIGRLWQTNAISVAQEHYCTAATQMIMARLYPWLFGTEKSGKRVVVACVGGELHELGARMVADFFELSGWDSYYLGANAPMETVMRAVTDRKADLLAVSATLATHVHLATEMVAAARASFGTDFPVIVGGAVFNSSPGLWKKTGADAWAISAGEAIGAANRLFGIPA